MWFEEEYLQFFRFKREEMKIQAWENHQKAKTEAEMRKIEVFDNFFCSIVAKVFCSFFNSLFPFKKLA